MIEAQAPRILTSPRLDVSQAGTIVSEFEIDVEREHRRGSTFYAYAFFEVDTEIAEYVKEYFGIDISDQVGMGYNLVGTWSDDWGSDWSYATLMESTDVYIPEEVKIIPARIEKQWKEVK